VGRAEKDHFHLINQNFVSQLNLNFLVIRDNNEPRSNNSPSTPVTVARQHACIQGANILTVTRHQDNDRDQSIVM
jgi:hypothetical protein